MWVAEMEETGRAARVRATGAEPRARGEATVGVNSDEVKREKPRNEGEGGCNRKMGKGIQQLLEALQCPILPHFGDAARDPAAAGDSLIQ
jgi:hypothetical protein